MPLARPFEISRKEDIFPEYQDTPIGLLLEYHNLNRPYETYTEAKLLIGMCMDNRKHLHIPENFSYIIRSGGANLRNSEFKVSYAIAVGSVSHIALIAHNNCGMVGLESRRDLFINGLVDKAGWAREMAEQHFSYFAPTFEIVNEIDFVISEAERIRARYPKITVAPMFYNVDNNRLHLIKEK
ncbi:MAG: carbonic anhydrase [Bacteroidia bacterium]|nr:MAG: carbonic anhydrase [Bacteroidia bacterium]